jgi:peptidyl-prolyl cis-trans isomerase D
MLQVIRERAQGFIVWFIVGAIILSFALWGINDYLRDDSIGSQVATVNGQEVSFIEYNNAYQAEVNRMQQMLGEQYNPDMFDAQIKKSALESVINNTLLTQTAIDLGLQVADEQVVDRIHAIEAFQEDGKFSKKTYEQTLLRVGQSPVSFENRMKRSLLADQIVSGVATTEFSTAHDIQKAYQLREQERKVGYLKLSINDFVKSVDITEDEIKEYYDSNAESFKTPERIQIAYLEVSIDDIAKDIEISDAELEEYYQEQKGRFTREEQRRAKHILFALDEDKSDDEVKAKAEDVYKKIQADGNFEELAKENSDDPGSASQGGDLGFFGRGVMVPAFEDRAFSMQVGEVSEPIKSEFGYHIIKLEEIKAGGSKPLAEVKDDLLVELKRQKAERDYFEKAERLATLTFESPQSLEPAVEELGLKVKTTGFFTRRGGGGITSNQKVISAAFSNDVLNENLNSEAVELSSNRTVVLRKKDYKPAKVRPLEEVKTQIESTLRMQKARKVVAEKGKEILAEAKTAEQAAAIAKKSKLNWTPTKWVKRNDGKIDAQVAQEVFRQPKPKEGEPKVSGFELANGDYVVAVISDVRQGDASKLEQGQEQSLRTSIANAQGFDEYKQLLETLKAGADIERFPSNL